MNMERSQERIIGMKLESCEDQPVTKDGNFKKPLKVNNTPFMQQFFNDELPDFKWGDSQLVQVDRYI